MTFNPLQLFLGSVLASLISLLAWRFRMLSPGGAAAAILLGTIVFGMGGLYWALLLIAFFSSSSLLSRFRRGKKRGMHDKFSKGSRRDAGQVLANGGVAGLFSLLNIFFPSNPILWIGFAGSLAAVNADTWATELGVLGKMTPRLISNWKPVEKGESGGITGLGTLAALAGALFIALPAVIAAPIVMKDPVILPVFLVAGITLAGFFGSLLDSLLGASLQASYYCPSCNKKTEHFPLHTCGSPTKLVGGQPWLDNDGVNLLCSFCGAGSAVLFWILMG